MPIRFATFVLITACVVSAPASPNFAPGLKLGATPFKGPYVLQLIPGSPNVVAVDSVAVGVAISLGSEPDETANVCNVSVLREDFPELVSNTNKIAQVLVRKDERQPFFTYEYTPLPSIPLRGGQALFVNTSPGCYELVLLYLEAR